MKKILVHAHIYYSDMWHQIENCVRNIKEGYDLYVTTTDADKTLINSIRSSFPEAVITCVENRGYDIAPFLDTLNRVDLGKYSFIVKIHTKRDMEAGFTLNGLPLPGARWREKLLSFISTRDAFMKALAYLRTHSHVGMLTDRDLIFDVDQSRHLDTAAYEEQKKYITAQEWVYKPYCFVAGTMFIARAKCFVKLQGRLSFSDFPSADNDHTSQLAHAIERILGFVVYNTGYIIDFVGSRKSHLTERLGGRFMRFHVHAIRRFFYQRKLTKRGRILVKIVKIPILSKKIK